jgi:hypothetical protein
MAARFAAIVPRMAVIGLVWLLATATLTYAAGEKLTTPAKVATTPAATPRPTLIVPDIRDQAFVFAKGILEDGGFGWRVTGSVHGYATNVVSTQQPAPGTRVVDTGAPTLKLTLRRGTYPQDGTAQNTSPYAGTSILLPKRSSAAAQKPVAAKPKRRSRRRRARSEPRSLLSSAPPGRREAEADGRQAQAHGHAVTSAGLRRSRRPQGAAGRDSAHDPGAAPECLADSVPPPDRCEPALLAVPARLDRHRREVWLVARSCRPASPNRRRSTRRIPVGHRPPE